MVKENIVTTKIYESDRNWIERIKRKFKKQNSQDTFRAIKRLIIKYKIEGELE